MYLLLNQIEMGVLVMQSDRMGSMGIIRERKASSSLLDELRKRD